MNIPLVLITGFLGSGKTCLMEQIIGRFSDKKLVYLVNEFSSIDIDGQRLSVHGKDMVMIPGGSIFCSCLVNEFIDILRWIPQRYGEDIEGVIIEASGMANPKVIARMLEETRLDTIYSISNIICVVDPGTFPVLRQTLPNILAQVEAADLILLNKTDLATSEHVSALSDELRQINQYAEIYQTTYAKLPLNWQLSGNQMNHDVNGEYAMCRDPNFQVFTTALHKPVDVHALQLSLSELGDGLYRVKGYVPTDTGVMFLEYAGGQWYLEPAPHASETPPWELVLITQGSSSEEMQHRLDSMNAC